MSEGSVDLPGDNPKPADEFEHTNDPTLMPLPASTDKDLKQRNRKNQLKSKSVTTPPSKRRSSKRLKTHVTPERSEEQKNLSQPKNIGATDPLKNNNE